LQAVFDLGLHLGGFGLALGMTGIFVFAGDPILFLVFLVVVFRCACSLRCPRCQEQRSDTGQKPQSIHTHGLPLTFSFWVLASYSITIFCGIFFQRTSVNERSFPCSPWSSVP